jgi:putative spermidine/putrescine transport system ATP-binding protein
MTLEVRGLCRRFGEFALTDVSLRLDSGDYGVLLGPSGCGKSLLLETIAGFHSPESGSVMLGERDATGEPPERRNIGFVFQRSALFPHMSVADNIGYGLRARRMPAARRGERIYEMVATLGLAQVLSRPVATLSGGEAQRVAVARALAIRPDLLLLDEPLSLIDHNARIELRDELARVHRELGVTTLHVTHSRDEARALGGSLAVMLGGHVVQQGATDEVFAQPRCAFVAEFLGLDPSTSEALPPCSEPREQRPPCSPACPAPAPERRGKPQ